MKLFKKLVHHLKPALLGLLIYLTIRIITDTAKEENHFSDDWHTWTIEITVSMMVGYLYTFANKFFNKRRTIFAKKEQDLTGIVKEFALYYLCILVITNATITIMVAFTDDGLSWHDLIMINTIPIFYLFIVFLYNRGNFFVKAYIDNKLQLERLARDKAEEELKFLKGQFQPHFLFNALNTIYFQMDESVEGAKKSIEKLSDLLRYRLYDDDSINVLLSKEVGYLKKYIEFQSIRASERLKINSHFQIANNGEKIYPFLLLPLVENAFKYVSGEMWIDINLKIKDGMVEFEISNSVDCEIFKKYGKGGIGLQNLEKRLKLLYNNGYHFETRSEENKYLAKLKVKLL